jgi:hypothetical protein
MDYVMGKILVFSIVHAIIESPVIAFILILAIAVVLFLHVGLFNFICVCAISIMLLFAFIKDSEDAALRAKTEPIIYPTQPQNGEPTIADMEIPGIPKVHNASNVEDEINTDPTVKNLNQLLNNSENLNPADRQKLEQMREDRIKQIMDNKGKSIIDDYNRNNPEPIVINTQNEKQETLPNSNKESIPQEKKQAKPNDKFISVFK